MKFFTFVTTFVITFFLTCWLILPARGAAPLPSNPYVTWLLVVNVNDEDYSWKGKTFLTADECKDGMTDPDFVDALNKLLKQLLQINGSAMSFGGIRCENVEVPHA